LYTRWLQYGVFQPIYRTHAQEEVPAEPVFWDETTKDIVRRYIKLRYQLLPYNYTLAYENATQGLPMMRPLFYMDRDPALLENTSSYLWGNDFLVSPVVEKGATTQKVYFPKKHLWFNFWTDEAFEGGQEVEVPVDLDNIPVFVRAGAFIPMVPEIQSTKDYSSYTLILHYYHDASVGESEGFVYEDDGETMDAHLEDKYELLKFTSEYTDEKLQVSVRSEGFAYEGKTPKRELQIVIHNLEKEPASVRFGKWGIFKRGKETLWNADARSLTLKMPMQEEAKVKLTWK